MGKFQGGHAYVLSCVGREVRDTEARLEVTARNGEANVMHRASDERRREPRRAGSTQSQDAAQRGSREGGEG